jgi:hypothetical protein
VLFPIAAAIGVVAVLLALRCLGNRGPHSLAGPPEVERE